MVKHDEERLRSISIYLIKKRIDKADEILRSISSLKVHEFPADENFEARLYIKKPRGRVPPWADLFDGYIENEAFGKSSSTAAVLLIWLGGRVFALPFGQGRYLLSPECYEERFGLQVALSSIGTSSLRSIDKQTFDSISKLSREQANREVGAADFGIDIEQDLLRAVVGRPEDETLGTVMSGMDALRVLCQIDFPELPKLLRKIYRKFKGSEYKKRFPWVDQISAISASSKIEGLDQLMVEKIKRGDFKATWLAVPEVIDWASVAGFRYTPQGDERHDMDWKTFLQSLDDPDELSISDLRGRSIYCMNQDDTFIGKWSVYKCIYCELNVKNETFFLNSGKWYQIEPSFVGRVNKEVSRIKLWQETLPVYNDKDEEAYNKRVCEEDPKKYALMDQKFIRHGGAYGRVEFCDLYSTKNEIVHVKRYSGSSSLSHLFSQGVVSGETFLEDSEFRKKVNTKLPKAFKLSKPNEPPKPGKYRVVFAIVDQSIGNLTLPFFARVNIRHAVRTLRRCGYEACLAKIEVAEELKKRRKVRKKGR